MRSLDLYAALVMRDGPRCYINGCTPSSDNPLEIEHFKPRAAGGTTELGNLYLACRKCNRLKGTSAITRRGKL
jgi:5-methylcytosine-specific restriction endonuclease McrA